MNFLPVSVTRDMETWVQALVQDVSGSLFLLLDGSVSIINVQIINSLENV